MEINNFFQSKIFKIVVWSIAGVAVLLVVFDAGMMVGFKKASFSFQWGENYHKNFGGPQGGFARDYQGSDLIDAHGITGEILKIDGPSIIIRGNDNVEKVVLMSSSTLIVRLRENIKPEDLKVRDFVVIIGEPSDGNGQIEAKFVRVMPPPPARNQAMPFPPMPPSTSKQ
jgi:hypothetical protein